ncbi:YihY/virulence factor BrkB family protein [Ottowia sp. VDI28]|uniref:YihY/virulence factor BrkB family protein n=1 Tax=Ottowia sp. VDI28 TaxID=3133968 RepID=UPI003C2DC570
MYPLYRSFELWSDADGLRMSAAMSFYGILSLAPLLILIVAGVGWWLDRQVLVDNLTAQIGEVVGRQAAGVINAALQSASQPAQGVFASVLAFGLLLIGATGVFAELQSAFERLWTQGSGVAAKEVWWHSATLRLRGVAYVLATGFLMLVSLVVSSMLNMLEHWGGERMGSQVLLAMLNQAVSVMIITGLFVALMRMSAGPQPRLRHLVVGSALGAVLFGLGKYGLALYLSTAAVVSAYGAAGSLVVLLMWIYFASAVLLYAASCARVLAEQQGEFSKAAVPPPAAAVTGAKGSTQVSTATVAAALADSGHPVNEEGRVRRGRSQVVARAPLGNKPPLRWIAMVAAAATYLAAKRWGEGMESAAALDSASWRRGRKERVR